MNRQGDSQQPDDELDEGLEQELQDLVHEADKVVRHRRQARVDRRKTRARDAAQPAPQAQPAASIPPSVPYPPPDPRPAAPDPEPLRRGPNLPAPESGWRRWVRDPRVAWGAFALVLLAVFFGSGGRKDVPEPAVAEQSTLSPPLPPQEEEPGAEQGPPQPVDFMEFVRLEARKHDEQLQARLAARQPPPTSSRPTAAAGAPPKDDRTTARKILDHIRDTVSGLTSH